MNPAAHLLTVAAHTDWAGLVCYALTGVVLYRLPGGLKRAWRHDLCPLSAMRSMWTGMSFVLAACTVYVATKAVPARYAFAAAVLWLSLTTVLYCVGVGGVGFIGDQRRLRRAQPPDGPGESDETDSTDSVVEQTPDAEALR